MAFGPKAVIFLSSSSHLLRSILAKSEFDKGFVSPAALLSPAASTVPFFTLLTGSLCRCRDRGINDSCVRPLPLL